ncbi:MAG: hypothetical protein B7X39_20365 [Lysobacterales bacterium 14-68-21]|jgi:hypothetical protein|nr:MAG: hypothetical protein B7X45_17210 [Xanthomonadales bacterium 15-68-25]OZB63032.1 MAG: hypothetical protein B7X39_20365 [Xanthomonadales bacterium 14-68-21]
MTTEHIVHVKAPGIRPPYYLVAELLWGAGCDFDSDGNSHTPEDGEWTELSLVLRSDVGQRVDIDPVSTEPLVLGVRSTHESLASQAARFLALHTGGALVGGV